MNRFRSEGGFCCAGPSARRPGQQEQSHNAPRRITGMTRVHLNLRWGKGIGWALLVVAGAGAVAGYLFVLPRWEKARGADTMPGYVSPSVRATRTAEDTLVVPPRVLVSLGVHTKKVTEARRPRTLPSLAGTLALHANRLG